MVWSYNNTMLGAYMDLYHFLTFVIKAKYQDIIIMTDIKKCPFTSSQISAAFKVFKVKMEFNRFLEIYKHYIYYPNSKEDIIQLLNRPSEWKIFYYNGHSGNNILATPFGNIEADFIYQYNWSKLSVIFDCCQPPTYKLPYIWNNSGYLIRDNIILTIKNTKLQDKTLVIISSDPEKYQFSTIYGSNFTKSILELIINSDDIVKDKIKFFPNYFIISNIRLDHNILRMMLFNQ